ncbi:hypothetical protein GCM10027589_04400 [Actinocorallia lasiicapitis]
MATAWIEGPLTGHWGTDMVALHQWGSWGGYRYSRVLNISQGTAELAVKGDSAPAPDPEEYGPAPAAVPHELAYW